jgi:hypothetical protein
VTATTALFHNFWRNELSPVVKQYATFEKLRADPATRAKFMI